MGYNPTTRNGHNMFVIASLLQKAIRRGDYEKAGYAAGELFGSYDSVLWKRLLVVSAEDCWGVLTKEIEYLHKAHIEANNGLKGYEKKTGYASVAVFLLCEALKSRDACYYSCNFIMSNNEGNSTNIETKDCIGFCQSLYGDEQSPLVFFTEPVTDRMKYSYLLYKSIERFDMENSGYAIKMLLEKDQDAIWKVLYRADEDFTNGILTHEIDSLVYADQFVNKKKKPLERDPLFICKAMLNIMYFVSGKFDTVLSTRYGSYDEVLEPRSVKCKNILNCSLENGEIPQYVYDVHTIEGKRAGHTDWEMNIVEHSALKPLMNAFFDTGSWELRYDYKHIHGLCSEKEYKESLEYRKTHESNPSIEFLK